MANKKTIAVLEAEIDRYMRRLNHAVRQIDVRRALIKKIRMGKVKQPPPPGKKVLIYDTKGKVQVHDFDDDLPSFGGDPNTNFD